MKTKKAYVGKLLLLKIIYERQRGRFGLSLNATLIQNITIILFATGEGQNVYVTLINGFYQKESLLHLTAKPGTSII